MTDLSAYLKEEAKSIQVSYNRRQLIVYALGIGCSELRFTYEDHPDFAAFPTYPIVLPFAAGEPDVVSFPSQAMMDLSVTPPVAGVRTLLDGERYLELLRPLPLEGTFKCTSKFVGIHARGQGALVESSSELSKDGVTYARFVSGAFLVGAKGFQDCGVTFSKQIKTPERAPDAVESSCTSPQQAHLYRLSGDYNPLHIDNDTATMNGFDVRFSVDPPPSSSSLFALAARSVWFFCAQNSSLLTEADSARPVHDGLCDARRAQALCQQRAAALSVCRCVAFGLRLIARRHRWRHQLGAHSLR